MKRFILFLFLGITVVFSWSHVQAGPPEIKAGYAHTVALKADGTVWTWGQNSYGQLGDGTTDGRFLPVKVSSLADVTAVAAGGQFTMALKPDGTVWAWGNNDFGQLGNGSTDNSSIPVQVSGLPNATDIAAGYQHSVALMDDGTVWAWGYNNYGQLGDGSSDNSSFPVEVSGLTSVIDIAAGDNHTLALKADGTLWAWGRNAYGQLGNGSTDNSSTPVQVSGLTNVTDIAAGYQHSVALMNDGTVWAWGYNYYGQLGNGTTADSSIPVQVSGLTNATDIAAGDQHSVALMNDGTVWAWGYNDFGQLGNASTSPSSVPVEILGFPNMNMSAISAGGFQTLTLQDDGTVWAWGRNFWGQLGDGTYYDRIAPVQVSGYNLFLSGEVQTYTITTTINSGGGFIAPGSVQVASGTDMTFTIISSTNYEIAMVLADGNYAGTVSSYTFENVIEPHTISVFFVPIIPICYAEPVRLGTQDRYYSIQDAYNNIALGTTETIYTQDVCFGEDLTLDRDVRLTLKGGYDCYFNEPSVGQTDIDTLGPLIIKSGTVIFEDIILR